VVGGARYRELGSSGEGRHTIGASVHARYGVYYIGLGLRGIALDPGWEKNILALARESWYNFAPLRTICRGVGYRTTPMKFAGNNGHGPVA
jgi:hypothetical protein